MDKMDHVLALQDIMSGMRRLESYVKSHPEAAEAFARRFMADDMAPARDALSLVARAFDRIANEVMGVSSVDEIGNDHSERNN